MKFTVKCGACGKSVEAKVPNRPWKTPIVIPCSCGKNILVVCDVKVGK